MSSESTYWSAICKCARLWLCAACCFATLPVLSAAAPYGHDFVRAGQSWTDAAPPRLTLDLPTPEAVDEQEYLDQLQGFERLGGPYSDALAEPLSALAHMHRQQGEWDQALALYRRASHVVRINDGLYSPRQVPLLRAQLDTYRLIGDMQALDDRYQYFFRLFGHGEPPYTDLRLGATLEYLRWRREWIRLDLDSEEKNRRRLLELYKLNEDLIEELGADNHVDRSWYRSLVMSQLRNLYLIQDRVQVRVEYKGSAPSAPLSGGDWNEKNAYTQRLENLQRAALKTGARLLQGLIENESQASAQKRARWNLELGDWYQWNDDNARANQYYLETWSLLRRGGEEERLLDWLGQPVELPDNGAFWQPRSDGSAETRVVVKAFYDISERGKTRNLRTEPVQADDQSAASRLRRNLKKTRFRPRYISGKAEPSQGIAREYETVK